MKTTQGKKAEKEGLKTKLPSIESFENQFRRYKITIVIPEYSSLCPKTGQPDCGTVTIEYEPDKRVIELKSLKIYIQAYRNLGIFYENSVNRIMEDINSAIKPVWIRVKGEFRPRGGIYSVIEVSHPRKT